ncbi:unnamed protein product [Ascophyllum nodosum]
MLETQGFPSCGVQRRIVVYNTTCPYGGRSLTTWFWLATLLWAAPCSKTWSRRRLRVVASWWYSPRDCKPVGAFCRAMGPSFGSLCKAAAITSAPSGCSASSSDAFLARAVGLSWVVASTSSWQVQATVDYALSYAICFIGIYGLSFPKVSATYARCFASRNRSSSQIVNPVCPQTCFSG